MINLLSVINLLSNNSAVKLINISSSLVVFFLFLLDLKSSCLHSSKSRTRQSPFGKVQQRLETHCSKLIPPPLCVVWPQGKLGEPGEAGPKGFPVSD